MPRLFTNSGVEPGDQHGALDVVRVARRQRLEHRPSVVGIAHALAKTPEFVNNRGIAGMASRRPLGDAQALFGAAHERQLPGQSDHGGRTFVREPDHVLPHRDAAVHLAHFLQQRRQSIAEHDVAGVQPDRALLGLGRGLELSIRLEGLGQQIEHDRVAGVQPDDLLVEPDRLGHLAGPMMSKCFIDARRMCRHVRGV